MWAAHPNHSTDADETAAYNRPPASPSPISTAFEDASELHGSGLVTWLASPNAVNQLATEAAMSRHETAVRFIESTLAEYATAPHPDMTAAAAQMAIELAYAQGDIDCGEHSHYSERRSRMVARHLGLPQRIAS